MVMKTVFLSLLFIAGISGGTSQAMADTEPSQISLSNTEKQQTDALTIEKASQWGLQNAEWQRYQQLMQGPLGTYSPNIDPLTALGIEARTDEERTRYAELQVQMETARITKLLAYQNTYDAAYKRLYPDMLPVNLVGAQAAPQMSPAKNTDRLAVFVAMNCPGCEVQVKALQRDGQPFDLYLVGSKGSDDSLRSWALKAGIKPDKVRSQQITLNHDGGRWISIGGKGSFPALLRQVNGQWVRQ